MIKKATIFENLLTCPINRYTISSMKAPFVGTEVVAVRCGVKAITVYKWAEKDRQVPKAFGDHGVYLWGDKDIERFKARNRKPGRATNQK